ncbi:hypothetical protein BIV60_09190 [Bacillus sp. MUM 116]|uniref:hypothetical protein n=1 Tax=Bacillus sp. MUM 116 TaxID=1678002 RepID=UPI0008F57DF7|nr:hypothetical protein [Bacillus sp. MUM 116]OIK15523.1 hypothetical protein BIV60_09190 [Bacillus sp. MUM 116]
MKVLINQYGGYELEKEKSNTSEDFFNRSEVTFVDDGEEKTLHVLYVRYFEEFFNEFTPYEQDPIFDDVEFKDIVALVCLIKNPGLRHRKRVYINSKHEFAAFFQDIDFKKLPEIFQSLKQNKNYELKSPLAFIMQPK